VTRTDFKRLRHFTPAEVTRTGARIKDVQFRTMFVADRFRHFLGCPVKLIKNGLTTGKHRDPAHPRGEAVDCYPTAKITHYAAYKAALRAGARAIGIYWNGRIYSYHLGLGPAWKSWAAVKSAKNAWVYSCLIVDPAKIR